MKICPKCQTGNSNETVMCRECGASLGLVSIQDEEAVLKTEVAKYERKQRHKRNLVLSGIILSGVLNIFFFIISIVRGTFLLPIVFFLFTPVMGYFCIFRSEAIFKYEHQYDIENVNEAKPTDWYYFKNMIGGVFIMVMGTAFMGFIAFH